MIGIIFFYLISVFLGALIIQFLSYFIGPISKEFLMEILPLIFLIIILMKTKKVNYRKTFVSWKFDKEIIFWGIIFLFINIIIDEGIMRIFPFLNVDRPDLNICFTSSILIFSMCLIIPILEETLFRRIILGVLLKKYSVLGSVIISGILFASLHGCSGISFILSGSAFYFAYIYLKTKCIWNSIITHIINNTIVCIIEIFVPKDSGNNILSNNSYYYPLLAISILLVIYSFYRMYRNIKKIEKSKIDINVGGLLDLK